MEQQIKKLTDEVSHDRRNTFSQDIRNLIETAVQQELRQLGSNYGGSDENTHNTSEKNDNSPCPSEDDGPESGPASQEGGHNTTPVQPIQ